MQKIVWIILCFQLAQMNTSNTSVGDVNTGQQEISRPSQQTDISEAKSNTYVPRKLSWDLEIPEPRKATRSENSPQNEAESKRGLNDDKKDSHFPYVGVSYKIDNPPYEETFIVPYVVPQKKKETGKSSAASSATGKNYVFIAGKSSTSPKKKQRKRSLRHSRTLEHARKIENGFEMGQLVIV